MHALPTTGYVRLPQIIGQKAVSPAEAAHNKQCLKGIRRPRAAIPAAIPVSASTWWDGVKSGRFPAPIKLGRITCWNVESIRALIEHALP